MKALAPEIVQENHCLFRVRVLNKSEVTLGFLIAKSKQQFLTPFSDSLIFKTSLISIKLHIMSTVLWRKWPLCFLIFLSNYEIISTTLCCNISGQTSNVMKQVTVISSLVCQTEKNAILQLNPQGLRLQTLFSQDKES